MVVALVLAAAALAAPQPVQRDWTYGLTDVQLRQIVYVICGPEGANDQIDWAMPREACERGDWNGQSYGYPTGDDEFFCDDFSVLDPERCGLSADEKGPGQ